MPVQAISTIPVMRPQLPAASALLPYLERIDQARYYSNSGPLLREFEGRLASFYQVDERQLAVVANGTVALSAALIAAGAKQGTKCLLPAWTFVGSAAAVWAANLTPHFIDVSPQTWMLDPADVRRRTDLHEVGAVMVVSAFGAPVDTRAWDAFTADTGIPVIIDGAASFETVASVERARPGRSPIMISLHATKVLGVGEGAIVISKDETFVHRLRQICNFGIWGSPEGQILGYNGKLSEYHAAVGLAALDGWSERRTIIERLTQTYRTELSGFPGIGTVPTFGDGWISCYCNIIVEGNSSRIIDRLAYMGIETRRWWRDGVHEQSAYAHFPSDPLPVTENLAKRVFGLPFFHDIELAHIKRIFVCLRSALDAPA